MPLCRKTSAVALGSNLGDSLALLCKAVGLDEATFLEIFELTRSAVNGPEKYDPAQQQKLRALYARTSKEDADRILGRWRRTSVYARKTQQESA